MPSEVLFFPGVDALTFLADQRNKESLEQPFLVGDPMVKQSK